MDAQASVINMQQYKKDKSRVYWMQMSHACSTADPPSGDHVCNGLRFSRPAIRVRMKPSVERAFYLGRQDTKGRSVERLKFI
jgi:hypothetical protein